MAIFRFVSITRIKKDKTSSSIIYTTLLLSESEFSEFQNFQNYQRG